jgi:FkbM family methyltransferase
MTMSQLSHAKSFLDKVQWKIKQKYSQLRCHTGKGYYIWKLDEKTRFVSRQEDAFSHVLYVCQGHEKNEMNWCRCWLELGQAGQSVVDCGANIGYFSAILSQSVDLSDVLAIEGNPKTAALCTQNLALLNIKNVQVVEAILSDDCSESYTIPDKPGAEPWQRAVKVSSEIASVHTTTLEQLIADFKLTPSLVKIDCEGFETLILKGASSLLSHIRPAFMIECNDTALQAAGTNRHELLGLLRSANYQLFHLASFTGSYPLGIALEDHFPASEFNFAAIPNDSINLDRWHQSISSFS